MKRAEFDVEEIARERCEKLLKLAKEAWRSGEKNFSKRYVQLARRIAMRHRFSLGQKSFCKRCSTIFIQGVTVKARLSSKRKLVVYTCLECGREKRIALRKKKAGGSGFVENTSIRARRRL